MKIAICDDNQQEMQRLHGLLSMYQDCHPGIEMEVDRFSSVEALSRQPIRQYELLLLDILMPQMNGIEFARLFRAQGGLAAVIFITSSPDFALDAFSVNAAQYLLKPATRESLFAALDAVIPALERRRAGSMVVSTQDGVKNLYYHSIVFVECIRHFAYFYLADGAVVRSTTLRQSFVRYIGPLLEDERFMHTHHSFVVNKVYVERLNQRDFELYGGHTVPISKDRLAEIKSSYLRYLDR